jgi:hypothetical protein
MYRERSNRLSGVHSIMMVNSAQPGGAGGGGARLPPFTLSTITSKVVMYAPVAKFIVPDYGI